MSFSPWRSSNDPAQGDPQRRWRPKSALRRRVKPARLAPLSYELDMGVSSRSSVVSAEGFMIHTQSHGVAPVHSEFADDPEYHEILDLFAEALPERRASLIAAFRSGDFAELRTLAHQLKGSGGGFGFRELTEHGAALEKACESGDVATIAAAFDALLVFMQRIVV